jgi:hypothetical protein
MQGMSMMSMMRWSPRRAAAAMFAVLLSAAVAPGQAALAAPPPPAKPAPDKAADRPPDKGQDKPGAAKKAMLSEAEARRFYVFFERLTAIVVANKADCPKMAKQLNAHVDANEELLKALAEAIRDNKELPAATKDRIAKKNASELSPALKKKCATDQTVTRAMARIRPPAAADREREREAEEGEHDRD